MTTRRSLLAGLALPAALTACHPALPVAHPRFAADHPDAELISLGHTIAGLILKADAAYRDATAAQELASEMIGPQPVKPRDVQLYPTDAAYHAAKKRFDEECIIVATRSMQIEKAIGLSALELTADEADDAVMEACERLAGMRATTVEGMAIKARLLDRGDWKELSRSIVDDLLALAGGVA